MKISNETKVGALTAIAITILVLGYNFLKGKNLFNKPKVVYAIYDNVDGLPNSSPVMYKGIQIGKTGNNEANDQYATKIIVSITLNKDILIPKNSIAIIKGSPIGLGTTVIDIKPGNDYSTFLKPGDTIRTNAPSDLLDQVSRQLDPVLFEVKSAVHSLDSVLKVIGNTFDPSTKSNFQGILANVNKTTSHLIATSISLETLLNTQTGALAKSLKNVEGITNSLTSFTDNLTKNNGKITSTLANMDKTSANLANLKLEETLGNVNKTVVELKNMIGKFNNDKGTLGLLLKDPDLYNSMNSLTFSLNTLIDDLKVNPKRYISIFGRKDKKIEPLKRPLSDTIPQP